MAKKPVETKRRVKNPETFRERVLKASESADKPESSQSLSSVKTGIKSIGKPFKALFNTPPFRFLGRLLKPVGWLFSKLLFFKAFSNSWQELRLVTWPNWQQSRKLTVAVLVFAIVFGAAVAGVDFVVEKAFRNLLLK